MSTIAVPQDTITPILGTSIDAKFVYFHNFDTGNKIFVKPVSPSEPDVTTKSRFEYIIPVAASATQPGRLEIQGSGGDTTLVNAEWLAYQNNTSTQNLTVGRW